MPRTKTPPCNKGCGQMIWFNWDAKAGEPGRSDMGKLRPLQVDVETGELLDEIHDCPNSTYGKKQGSNGQTKSALSASEMQTLLGNSYDHAARLEKIEGMLTAMTRLLTQISGKVDGIAGQTHINNNSSESVQENTGVET